METTQSATELVPVVVEYTGSGVSDVWLNRNITELELTNDDGSTQPVWFAEQAHGTVAGTPSAEDIEADFNTWWATFEGTTEISLEELADALAELSEIDSDNAAMLSETMDALAELSEIVSELVGGEQ